MAEQPRLDSHHFNIIKRFSAFDYVKSRPIFLSFKLRHFESVLKGSKFPNFPLVCIKKARVFRLSERFQTRDRRKLTYKQAEKKVCLRNLLTIMEILERKIIDFHVCYRVLNSCII